MMKASMLVFLVCLASQRAEVKLNSQTQENIRNWLDSISKNNRRGAIENKNTIQKEVDQEQQAFNSMKRELRFAQRKNYLTRDRREDSGHGTDRFTEEPTKCLPVGSEFRYIIENNIIYVDKTDTIHRMIKTQKYVFLSRPPRFGKSLLLSTLRYLFEGGPSNKKLFNGTKIQNTIRYEFPEHTVLQFDFSEVASYSVNAFNVSLRSAVEERLEKHGINNQRCVEQQDMKLCLKTLLDTLYERTGRMNVVLIDEYDDPLRNFEGNEKDRDNMLVIMQNFFKVVKSNIYIRFCFVTGPTKIALSGFLSGYNCATDISWFEEYETIVGFSQNELRTYFNEYIKAKAMDMNMSEDQIIQLLDSHFEGYRFSLKDEHMYNSQDVIDFFQGKRSTDISSYHTKIDSRSVVKVIREIPKITMVLNLMAELKTEEDMIPVDVAFIRGFKESLTPPKAVLKALYEGGFLSVKKHESFGPFEPDIYYIGFTNKVVREHFLKLSENVISKTEMGFEVEYDPGYEKVLEERNMPSFLARLSAQCANIPSLLEPKDKTVCESFYQLAVYYGLLLSGMQAEWEIILNTGRLDVSSRTDHTNYIFELKRKDNREWRDAMKQCNVYALSKYFQNRQIVCIGIVFEDKPTVSKRVIHAWGMFEKFSNGSFLPNRNSFEMNKYEAEVEPVSTIEPAPEVMKETRCDRCGENFKSKSEFEEHLKGSHKSDIEFIKDNLMCPYCWKSFLNRAGLGMHIKSCKKRPKDVAHHPISENLSTTVKQ